jgi:hypothetical protein
MMFFVTMMVLCSVILVPVSVAYLRSPHGYTPPVPPKRKDVT